MKATKKPVSRAYCSECVWFLGEDKLGECEAPENKGTWYSDADYRSLPATINKDNDCEWYVGLENKAIIKYIVDAIRIGDRTLINAIKSIK